VFVISGPISQKPPLRLVGVAGAWPLTTWHAILAPPLSPRVPTLLTGLWLYGREPPRNIDGVTDKACARRLGAKNLKNQ